jgi:ribonuclease HI
MVYLLATLECNMDNYIENNLIPFKKKIKIRKDCFKYVDCIIFNKTFNLIKDNDKIKILEYKKEDSDIYYIYSDGGSYNNGYKNKDDIEIGSYANVITINNKEIVSQYSKAELNITNNYSELFASISGIRFLMNNYEINKTDKIILCSDSQYLMKGINEWMEGWIKRGWKNNENKPTLNKELWVEMKNYLDNFNLFTLWCRGHQTDNDNIYIKYNNICDIECNKSINIILSEHGKPIRKIKNGG